VLLRAARPLEGIETARLRRPARPDAELMRGPANLARALGVDADLNRHPLDLAPLRLTRGRDVPDAEVAVGPRVGITRAVDLPLRFGIRDDPHVSRPR
jgi:DNA-3-methyladenine glycosylase